MSGEGALPDSTMYEMLQDFLCHGSIVNGNKDSVCPGSYDLSISEEIYRLNCIVPLLPDRAVPEYLSSVAGALSHPPDAHFERGIIYIARIRESFRLPRNVQAYCNPKSSTGRNDIHVRIMAAGYPRYDAVPPGFSGELWALIICKSYPVIMKPGEKLAQIRFRNIKTQFLRDEELEMHYDRSLFLWDASGTPIEFEDATHISDRDGGLILRVDMSEEIVGYECLGTNAVLDFSRRDNDPRDFFRPLIKKNGKVELRLNGFYIFRTRECVRVPPGFACEMVPMDERSGEFRTHYAGFIDPGWGWGESGEGKGRQLVLEVRPHEGSVGVFEWQGFAKIRFERMAELPREHYDARTRSHYRNTDHLFSKHFKKMQS